MDKQSRKAGFLEAEISVLLENVERNYSVSKLSDVISNEKKMKIWQFCRSIRLEMNCQIWCFYENVQNPTTICRFTVLTDTGAWGPP